MRERVRLRVCHWGGGIAIVAQKSCAEMSQISAHCARMKQAPFRVSKAHNLEDGTDSLILYDQNARYQRKRGKRATQNTTFFAPGKQIYIKSQLIDPH